jgi:hypothetical protein
MVKGLRWWWYVVAAGLAGGGVRVAHTAGSGRRVARGVDLANPGVVADGMPRVAPCYAVLDLFGRAGALSTVGRVVGRGSCGRARDGAGTGIRLLVSSDWQAAAAWLAGALFIPSLALALGVWSGSSKLFEALYTVWWYVGPLHQLPSLDFVAGPAHRVLPAGI